MKVCVYCRVACKDEQGLAAQIESVQRYAKEAGHTVIGTYAEHGSGMTLERPALQALNQAILMDKPEMVVMRDISRIGRSPFLIEGYIGWLKKHKVNLLCINDRILFSPNGEFPI